MPTVTAIPPDILASSATLQFNINGHFTGSLFSNNFFGSTSGEFIYHNKHKSLVSLFLMNGSVGIDGIGGNITILKLSDKESTCLAQYMTRAIRPRNILLNNATAFIDFPVKVLGNSAIKSDGINFTLKKKGVYRLSFILPTGNDSTTLTTAQFYANGFPIGIVFSNSAYYSLFTGKLLYENTSSSTTISLSVTGIIQVLVGSSEYGNGTILIK